MTTPFVKLALTRCLNSTFLLFNHIHIKEIPILFTLGKNCKRTVSRISGTFLQRFVNFMNLQMLLMAISQQFILNFQFDSSKR